MAKYELGEIRRSQLLQNGPGAIIDFRAGDQGGGPVSVLTSGLEHWEQSAKIFAPINIDTNVVFEPRLQAKLNKRYFRQSPVVLEDKKKEDDSYQPHIQGVRFPGWMVCPVCDRLVRAKEFSSDIGDPSRWCAGCSEDAGSRVHVVPVRFVAACEHGHIEDFPWEYFLERSSGRKCKSGRCRLVLRSDGNSSALESLFVKCLRCKAEKSLGSIFSKDFFQILGINCSGNMPWIGSHIDCGGSLKTVQRGASNIYFAKVESALSIPPWDNPLEQQLPLDWAALRDISSEARAQTLTVLASSMLMEPEELIEQVERRLSYSSNIDNEDLRTEEYLNFVEATDSPPSDSSTREFRVRRQIVPTSLGGLIETLVKVERLKEVRVQTGFSRIVPPAPGYDPDDEKLLSSKALDWLPASVIQGEGIFFALNEKMLTSWKEQAEVVSRTEEILTSYQELLSARGQDYEEQDLRITPEFVLIHSLAHLIIRQLSLSSGYNTASIRERVYCGGDAPSMRGVLIFTGTSDSDGTLGGLARLSEPALFEALVKDAVADAIWCASDPICSDGISSVSESSNKAACHSCILLPETSCEHFNSFLDRAFIVGTVEDRELGFFKDLLDEVER